MDLIQPRRASRPSPLATVTLALSVIVLFILKSTANAASISASTQICFGFQGSVENPQLVCQPGASGVAGGGVVVIGGGGEGSGINVPFQSDGFGTEISAFAEALSDFGIFRGRAGYRKQEQHPDLFGGVYSARANGGYEDEWTIGGNSGQGRLQLTYTVSGGATLNAFVVGGNGSEFANGGIFISVLINGQFAGGIPTQQTGGTYVMNQALPFTFGVPFNLGVTHTVFVDGGYDRLDPPDFFLLETVARFEHTATLTGIAVTDLLGNPITNFSLSAQSGTQYPLVASVVPLPAGVLLLASGVMAIGTVRLRRRLN